MAKWLCPCGNPIRSSGEIPNPQEWRIIADRELDDAAWSHDPGPGATAAFLDQARYVYRCERCDRLHIFWDGIGEWPPTIYAKEDG